MHPHALTITNSAREDAAHFHHSVNVQLDLGNDPASDEIDVALNYADYYYLEALSRCKALPK
ncbi:MAG: hypothetical protein ABUL62_04120 [Myxococcales bacterium]